MTAMDALTTWFVSSQDYFWFLACLGWLSVLILSLRRLPSGMAPGLKEERWLCVLLPLDCVLIGATAMAFHVSEEMHYGLANWTPDVVLTAMVAAVPVIIGRFWARGLGFAGILVAAITVVAIRWPWPMVSAASLTALGLVGGVMAWRRLKGSASPQPERGRTALLLGVLPGASQVGLLGELVGDAPRWRTSPELGIVAAFLLLAAAMSLLPSLWRITLSPGSSGPKHDREPRILAASALTWVVAGLGFSYWAGHAATRDFGDALLAQVRMAATTLAPQDLQRVLGPQLVIEFGHSYRTASGVTVPLARAPALTEETVAPLRGALDTLAAASGLTAYTHVETIRGEYLVSPVFDSRMPGLVDIGVSGRALPEDLAAWDSREPQLLGPRQIWDTLVRARAPVFGPDGDMLGWLAFDVNYGRWAALQARARYQAFAVVSVGLVLIVTLVVLRQRAQEARLAETAAESAREADRGKTIFLAKVSHELRTPVQNILGYCELMQRKGLAEETADSLEAVRTQGRMLVRLINDLIDLSAAQAGAFRLSNSAFDLGRLINQTVRSFESMALEKGLELRLDLPPGLPIAVSGDAERCRQVLGNLLSNALKFTRQGWVRVEVSCSPEGDTPTEHVALTLRVIDTGPGIPADKQSRLFEPFERLGAKAPGTGLGLSLTRAISRAMGGDLRVESDGRSGTTSTVVLRLRLADVRELRTAEVDSGVSLAGLRVVVAEDNLLVRELFKVWLEEAGAVVIEACDGAEALQAVRSHEAQVLLSDQGMPWMDGLDVVRKLRSEGYGPRRLHVILVSAEAGIQQRNEVAEAGADGFLLKPCERSELLAVVAPALALRRAQLDSHFGGSVAALDSGSDALERKFLLHFAQEAPVQEAALREAWKRRDCDLVARLAHHFGNSAFALQDKALAAASRDLENAARSGRLSEGLVTALLDASSRAAGRQTLPNKTTQTNEEPDIPARQRHGPGTTPGLN